MDTVVWFIFAVVLFSCKLQTITAQNKEFSENLTARLGSIPNRVQLPNRVPDTRLVT